MILLLTKTINNIFIEVEMSDEKDTTDILQRNLK